MTTITIERELLEQALDAIQELEHASTAVADKKARDAKSNLRAALAAPATAPAKLDPAGSDDVAEEMSAVADQYAHKLALDLECVLADYSGTWYDTAIGTLGAYREAMNAIHERQSPTFMGEPVIRPALAAPATAPDELEQLRKDAERQPMTDEPSLCDYCKVLACQVESLRSALTRVMDTHEKEARLIMSYQVARENFSDSSDERKAHELAVLEACSAEREARALLLMLKPLHEIKGTP